MSTVICIVPEYVPCVNRFGSSMQGHESYTWMRQSTTGKGIWFGLVSSSCSFLECVISGNAFVDKAFAEVHDFFEFPVLVNAYWGPS